MIHLLAAVLLWAGPARAASPLDAVVSVSAPAGLEFHAICRASKLPCAIEIDDAAAGDPAKRRAFHADDVTVSTALARAIQLYPGHRWRLRKGVIYVTPNSPVASSPLDRPLSKTRFTESLGSARTEFGTQAGFCDAPRPADSGRSDPSVSFEVADATATPRAVLNGLVFRRGGSAWVVERAKTARGSVFCLDLLDYEDEP